MKNLGTEIKRAREAKRWTQEQMAEKLGITMRQYNKYEGGEFPKYKQEVVFKIDELLGTSIREQIYEVIVPRELLNTVAEKPKDYIQKRREDKNLSKPYLVPLVPVKAQAGYARSYANSDFIETLEVYPILPGIDPRGAMWRYFEVQGDSMEPGLFESDLVLVSMVPPEDWQDLKKEQVYVVVTDEDVYIKLVYAINSHTWVLKSSNKKHKEKVVQVADVKELWQYRRLQRGKIQWPKQFHSIKK